jgi:secondary thiamine-phosphate synthase enzyme
MDNSSIVYWQKTLTLPAKSRGFHLITQDIIAKLHSMPRINIGLLQLFIQHTSASLVITENASQEVPIDLENYFNQLIPEHLPYQHDEEGPDDMPAHIKNCVLGSSLTIPLKNNSLLLGRWQGIFLCEHRNRAGERHIIITAQGGG